MHRERRANKPPDHVCHFFVTLLRKVQTIQRRPFTAQHICKEPTRNQDDTEPLRKPSLNKTVAIAEWREWQFEHNHDSPRTADDLQKFVQRLFELLNWRISEHIVPADFENHKIIGASEVCCSFQA